MAFSKCILIALVATAGFLALAEGGFIPEIADGIDEKIFKSIERILEDKYPDEPALIKCIIRDFKGSKLVEKFYTRELIFNTKKLAEEIEPHLNMAERKCKVGLFLQSPVGLLIIIVLVLVVILICCCLIKCLCC